jgi:hypothetical protein
MLSIAPRKDDALMTEHGFPEVYPPFSWDTVPVYQMFADARLFTEQEVSVIAETTDFICVEKQHGIGELGAADLGAKHAIHQFKAAKPQMTCLVYLNSAYAYPFVSPSKVFDYRTEIHRPENATYKSFLLTDPETGELAYRESDHVHYFDVLNPELRAWWVETVGAFVREAGADGLFVDQIHGFSWLRPERADEVAEAHALMMRMAKKEIGEDKVLLLNNAAHIPKLFEIGDAFMFEHYNAELISKEKIVEDWALMRTIAQAGKSTVWRIGVEHDDLYLHAPPEAKAGTTKHATLEAISRKRIGYYLAAFLIGAQEQSYFQYGWGWELRTGPLCDHPELNRPLGNPAGDYVRTDPAGWTFRRDFHHASVEVDLEKREGCIDWKR